MNYNLCYSPIPFSKNKSYKAICKNTRSGDFHNRVYLQITLKTSKEWKDSSTYQEVYDQ